MEISLEQSPGVEERTETPGLQNRRSSDATETLSDLRGSPVSLRSTPPSFRAVGNATVDPVSDDDSCPDFSRPESAASSEDHTEDGTLCFPIKPDWAKLHFAGFDYPASFAKGWDHEFRALLDPRSFLPTHGNVWPTGKFHCYVQPWCICPFCTTRNLVFAHDRHAAIELAVYLLPRCFRFASPNSITWLNSHSELVLDLCVAGYATILRTLAVGSYGPEYWDQLSRS
jgi:hypothetical protein